MDIQPLAQAFEDALLKVTGDQTKISTAQQQLVAAQSALTADTPPLATAKDALIAAINQAFAAVVTVTPPTT